MFSGMVDNIDDFGQYRVVLSIRDPRDILVSNYFSIAHSHVEPPQEGNKRKVFLEKRAWAQGVSIDEFVLKDAERLHAIFDRYRRSLENSTNVRIVKYEDMIDNYREWLMDLTQKTRLKMSDALEQQLIDQNNKTKPRQEDKLAHNRKGIAGDHKEKLKQETIDQLNDRFREVLLFFQYEV